MKSSNGHRPIHSPVIADQKDLHQLYVDIRCNLEDLSGAMDDRDGH